MSGMSRSTLVFTVRCLCSASTGLLRATCSFCSVCPAMSAPPASIFCGMMLAGVGGGGDLRQDKSISVEPVWILGVEGHEFVEEDVGHWGHAHRSARMTGVGLEGGIDLMDSSSVKVSGVRDSTRASAFLARALTSCWESGSFGWNSPRGVGLC
jgi:hypothetical protein